MECEETAATLSEVECDLKGTPYLKMFCSKRLAFLQQMEDKQKVKTQDFVLKCTFDCFQWTILLRSVMVGRTGYSKYAKWPDGYWQPFWPCSWRECATYVASVGWCVRHRQASTLAVVCSQSPYVSIKAEFLKSASRVHFENKILDFSFNLW